MPSSFQELALELETKKSLLSGPMPAGWTGEVKQVGNCHPGKIAEWWP